MSGGAQSGARRGATPGRLPAAGLAGRGPAFMSLGTPAEKAQAILTYLREHRLIDW